MLEKILKKRMKEYGVVVTNPATGSVYHAFIQPLRYKSRMYLEAVKSRIGEGSESRFLYVGPPEEDITQMDETDCLISDGVRFYSLLSEPVWFAGKVLYYRAVLKKVREAD